MRYIHIAVLTILFAFGSACFAQENAAPTSVLNPPAFIEKTDHHNGMWAGNTGKFFEGAVTALFAHEGGHYIANACVGSKPYLQGVHYGPIPFFTIQPNRFLTKREHYITASAGFLSQNLVDEWILTKHPDLKDEDEPYFKGVASFNFWLTVGYAATAFAGSGPKERDTKGMANSLGWNEKYVGAMILVPTALDTYRYKHPKEEWAATASRLSKLAMIVLLFTPKK